MSGQRSLASFGEYQQRESQLLFDLQKCAQCSPSSTIAFFQLVNRDEVRWGISSTHPVRRAHRIRSMTSSAPLRRESVGPCAQLEGALTDPSRTLFEEIRPTDPPPPACSAFGFSAEQRFELFSQVRCSCDIYTRLEFGLSKLRSRPLFEAEHFHSHTKSGLVDVCQLCASSAKLGQIGKGSAEGSILATY